jgi:hypothetical protein
MPPKIDPNEEKFNTIIQQLKSLSRNNDEVRALLTESLNKVQQLEENFKTLENRMSAQEQEIFHLKNNANHRDIHSRSCTVRLLGYPALDQETKSTDGGKAFTSAVFEKILKPILLAAKNNNAITVVPTVDKAVESLYRAGKILNPAKPPPIIINFTSKQLRLAVLRHKRNNIQQPQSSSSDPAQRMFIVEDLTPPTARMMRDLKEEESVAKVWSIEGRLRFTMRAAPDAVHIVKSVFVPIEKFLPK